MNTLLENFFYENKSNFKIERTEDKKFLILKNVDFKTGAALCKKYKASGSSCGRKSEHFKIGNFGEYN